MSKNIRSKVVRESLLDYNTLANSLKENTESAVKALLGEAVRDTYAKLLSEDDDKDYEEGEVEDTSSDITNDAESSDVVDDGQADADAGMDAEGGEAEGGELEGGDSAIESDPVDDGAVEGEGGDEWAEFDKYKVSDDEYDFTNAEDEEIVKVYKLMKNDDQILVHKDDNGNVNIQDNETGAEYLINLGDNGEAQGVAAVDDGGDDVIADEDGADDFGAEDDFENNEDDMNESTEKMFELMLEYDSNVGYTDNYQKKDVMTNPGMSEPGKNVNDWDAGVPHGTEKPWSGYPGKKSKADKPFNAGKGKQIEEGEDVEGSMEECGNVDAPVEEATNVGGFVQQNSTSKSHVPNSNGRNARSMSKGGKRVKGTATPRYSGGEEDSVSESFMKRANKALSENQELKSTLTDVMKSLKEAAVTNHNLGMIIKLISENSTTQDEKKEIISRFSKEAKTVDASKTLYESISRDLQKSKKMNITEDKSLTVEGSKKINETKIYQSKDVLDSLDLMHRMMK
jgi:hypothetical protein